MNNISTAKEVILLHFGDEKLDNYTVEFLMKEFAAMHVKAALEAAAENVSMKKECGCKTESECHAMFCCDTVIDKDSILNAYSSENIK